MKYLPIGIQTFRDIIEGGFYYVDKTQFIPKLTSKYNEVRKSKENGYKWVNHKWEKLYDLAEYNNQRGNNKNRSNNRYFNERNFKAHCGFENNITEVSLLNDKDIIVRYSPDRFEEVVKTLLKS